MEARQVKAAPSVMRNKTDKNDARGIAQLLRSGWYRPVYLKSMQSHRIRALLSSRKAVPDKCFDLENKIRGLFKVFGIKLPLKLGHGEGHVCLHNELDHCAPQQYLPGDIRGTYFYTPSNQGYEADVADRLERWRLAQRKALGITDTETLPDLTEDEIKVIKGKHK